MILEQINRNVRVSGMGGSALDFSIDNEDFGFISGILTDKLYSNKIMAVIREYSCNAIDANIEAGSKQNVLITVPSMIDPVFKVRDFGAGLSEDDVRSVYVKLGKSTKRDSNAVTGTFGLGAKSGFCYTDSFLITSWYNGKRYSYNAQKTADSRLILIPLAAVDSNEPSGVEISIPVNKNDVNSFVSNLQRFIKYVSAPVDFKGGFVPQKLEKLSDYGDFFTEKDFLNRASLLMGNVLYPIEQNHLCGYFNGVVICAEIGDVDVAPDREKLEYTEKTIRYLKERSRKITEVVSSDVQNQINKLAYPYEAYVLIAHLSNVFGSAINTQIKNYTFKGRKFDTCENKYIALYRQGCRGGWRHSSYLPSISNVADGTYLVIEDKDKKLPMKLIVNGIVEKTQKPVRRVLVSNDKDVLASLMTDLWEPSKIITDWKSLCAKRKSYYRPTGVRAPRRTIIYTDAVRKAYNAVDIKSVTAAKNYVVFSDDNTLSSKDHDLCGVARSLSIPYYGVSAANVKHLDSSWNRLEEVVKKKISDFMKDFSIDGCIISKMGSCGEANWLVETYKDYVQKGEYNLVKEIARNTYCYSTENILKLAKELGININPSDEMNNKKKAYADFLNKYSFILGVRKDIGYKVDSYASGAIEFIKALNKNS